MSAFHLRNSISLARGRTNNLLTFIDQWLTWVLTVSMEEHSSVKPLA